MLRKTWRGVLALAATLAMVTAMSPLVSFGADHLDAPALNPTTLVADINDLYAFTAEDPNNTVLAITVSPAAGAIGPDTFGTDILYQFNVFDAPDSAPVADTAYRAKFDAPDADGNQPFKLYKATGAEADGHSLTGTVVAEGTTNSIVEVTGGGHFFAGLRSDPFFFDLAGFQGTVGGANNGRGLGDGLQTDFFEPLNVLALVLELPDSALPSQTDDVALGVWASTAQDNGGTWDQTDRMGRPAINTVVGSTGPIVQAPVGLQDLYNSRHPKDDLDAAIVDAAAAALTALSSLDSEGAYSSSELGALAGVLLPDVLTFSKNETGLFNVPPLNGRALADDVIDVELRIVTGGDPLGLFPGRDADGAVNSDGIGPHDDYLSSFPYLGVPRGGPVFPVDPIGVVDQDTGVWYIQEAVTADLSGANEVPSGSGDPNGSGRAVVAFNEATGGVCFNLDLFNVQGTVGAAHIHEGAAGVNGGVVVDLDWPTNGTEGCVSSTTAQVDAILADPSGYYVNVHTNLFPAGAVRGQLSGDTIAPFFYGDPADTPLLGDWDGDGTVTPGLHRTSDGKIYLRNSNTQGNADIEFFFGNPGDIPLAGDWDGDGDDTVSLYRPSEARFYIINELGSNEEGLGAADFDFLFGDVGDRPFVGDWDGDGIDEVGLHRVSTGRVYGRNTLDTGIADFDFIWGDPNDSVFGGDWDGDGFDTPGLFRPSDQTNYLRNSLTPGIADTLIFTDGFESGDTSAWTSSK